MISTPISFSQRKIKKNYRSITGHFPSVKNSKSIAFESKLEKAYFLSLEFDNNVISYQEQPQIEINSNYKTKIYSADCYVKRIDSSLKKDSLVEVKYSTELDKKKEFFEKKFNEIKVSTDKLNLDFEVYTEKCHSEIYLFNLDFLYRYKQNPIKNNFNSIIQEVLIRNQDISALELSNKISQKLNEYPIIANTIWSMVANNEINTNYDSKKITMESKLRYVNV